MESMKPLPHLSVIIPTMNEAQTLPLLLADLKKWPIPLEILVIDSMSSDATCLIAKIGGAKTLQVEQANRGLQLHLGASISSGEWLLFLHADSRLPSGWPKILEEAINSDTKDPEVRFFEFRVNKKGLNIKLLELLVFIRSNWLKRPYGDQGLLIRKSLYNSIGGFKPLELLEDLELIERISNKIKIKSLHFPLYTNSRRWEKKSVIINAYKNFMIRKNWRQGESISNLYKKYYGKS